MSEVKFRKPDLKDMIATKAEELAEQRYGREFNDLPPQLQVRVWMEAEQAVHDDLATAADLRVERPSRNGNDHWAELELMRRLGK